VSSGDFDVLVGLKSAWVITDHPFQRLGHPFAFEPHRVNKGGEWHLSCERLPSYCLGAALALSGTNFDRRDFVVNSAQSFWEGETVEPNPSVLLLPDHVGCVFFHQRAHPLADRLRESDTGSPASATAERQTTRRSHVGRWANAVHGMAPCAPCHPRLARNRTCATAADLDKVPQLARGMT
jgi:hypothetical protein